MEFVLAVCMAIYGIKMSDNVGDKMSDKLNIEIVTPNP